MSKSTSGESFEGRSTSQRVIETVAEKTGNDPTEVGPLYHVIDPDALDRLFAATGRNGRSGGYVEFTFAGCHVVVRGNGEIDVTEHDAVVDVDEPGLEASLTDDEGGATDGDAPHARSNRDGVQ